MAKRKKDEQNETQPGAETVTAPPREKISKMDAVRAALKEGNDSPADGVPFVKERFGLDVSAQMFSSYKSKIGAEGGKPAGKPGRKPGPKPRQVVETAVSLNGSANHGRTTGAAELAAAVKKLVDQYGASEVTSMAAVFGGVIIASRSCPNSLCRGCNRGRELGGSPRPKPTRGVCASA